MTHRLAGRPLFEPNSQLIVQTAAEDEGEGWDPVHMV